MAAAASRDSSKIRPIDRAAVHRICSGQVVLDLATAVKELVENSLDAGATNVEVRLKEYGAETFEVADNGSGVTPENYQGLTLKYHTSKISEFADLQQLSSFGFRGEALSSLCALGSLSVHTKSKDDTVGTLLHYDQSGLIISQGNVARSVGTTVTVAKLFSPLPVRHKEFTRNIRREYGRVLTVLQAYALIAKGVRLTCTNQMGKGARTTLVQTHGSKSLKDNVINVFGTKTAASLEWLELPISSECRAEGFVSKPGSGCGRSSGDRQFFYVNGRPVDMPKVAKLLNEQYKSFNSQQYPMIVLNILLPTTAYDVNVTPDKRKVFLHAEGELMTALRDSLEAIYAPSKYTYVINTLESENLSKKVARLPKAQVTSHGNKTVDFESNAEEELEAPETPEQVKLAQNPSTVVMMDPGTHDVNLTAETATRAVPSKPHLDLRSFGHKGAISGDAIQRNAVKELKSVAASYGPARTNNPATSALNVVQSRLTSFVSQDKRDYEEGRSLFSEEPVLKKCKWQSTGVYSDAQMTGENNAEARREKDLLKSGALAPDDCNDAANEIGCAKVGKGINESLFPCDLSKSKTIVLEKDVAIEFNDEVITAVKKTSNMSIKCIQISHPVPNHRTELDDAEFVNLHKSFANAGKDVDDLQPQLLASAPGSISEHTIAARAMPESSSSARPGHPKLNHVTKTNEAKKLDSRERAYISKKSGCIRINGANLLASHSKTEFGFNSSPVDTASNQDEDAQQVIAEKSHGAMKVPLQETAAEVEHETVAVQFDFSKFRMKLDKGLIQLEKSSLQRQHSGKKRRHFAAATVASDFVAHGEKEKEAQLVAAAKELERSFNKADFKRMQVLGQFNLGFILAKIDQDIFIVDQHASDEKYNFERLSKTTILNRQPLLRHMPLEFTAAEELTVTAHLEAFRKNGFDFVEDEKAPPGQRLKLSAVPFSKNVTFGIGDVQELVALLADEPVTSSAFECDSHPVNGCQSSNLLRSDSRLPRPTRVRAMLASRACRSSIMIGDPLCKKEMEKVLVHLADLDAPWNCPHGRPTMRHLVDLSAIGHK